jgi:hypothetical protein
MCWKWKYFSQFSFNQFNSSQFHFNKLNGGSIYRGVRSSVDVQMDIDRRAGEPEEHLGARLSMGLDCILLHDIKRSH